MRLYKDLETRTIQELYHLKDMVSVNDDLSFEEKFENMKNIQRMIDVKTGTTLQDIEASSPDYSDIGA